MSTNLPQDRWDFFIAHAAPDRTQAQRLCELLEQGGARVFIDTKLLPGDDWGHQLTQALRQSSATVALISENTSKAHYQRDEIAAAIRLARETPSRHRVIPIYLSPSAAVRHVPYGLHVQVSLTVSSHCPLEEIARQLVALPQRSSVDTEWPKAILAPSLPARYVERSAEYTRLRNTVLREQDTAVTGLVGAGGFGKTTLALYLCHDDEVLRHFRDGIFWLSITEHQNAGAALQTLYYQLTGTVAAAPDEQSLATDVERSLEGRRVLVILDDLWDKATLDTLLRATTGAARVVTTRKRELVEHMHRVEVGELTPWEAARLLGGKTELAEADRDLLVEFATSLGNWALVIDLAARRLHRMLSSGVSLRDAVADLAGRYHARGARAFDARNARDRDQAIALTIDLSLEELGEADRTSCCELAVFEKDIPTHVAAELWDVDFYTAEDLLIDLDERSLLRYDDRVKSAVIHDVIRGEFLLRLEDPPAVHRRLVASWGEPLHLPHTYAWLHVARHLVDAQDADRLRALLEDFEWLVAKLAATSPIDLLGDFDRLEAGGDALLVLRDAIQLSADRLAEDPYQLPAQLLGRLGESSDEVQEVLSGAKRFRTSPWLNPVRSSLTPPIGQLERILYTHASQPTRMCAFHIGSTPHLVAAGKDDSLHLWNLATGSKVHELETPGGRPGVLLTVSLGGTPHVVLTEGARYSATEHDRDWDIRIWNLATGALSHRLQGHETEVGVLRFFQLSGVPHLLSSGTGRDPSLRVWNLANGAQVHELHGHRNAPEFLKCFESGGVAYAVSGGGDPHRSTHGTDPRLAVWNLESGSAVWLAGHAGRTANAELVDIDEVPHVVTTCRSGYMSPDDSLVIVWNAITGERLHTLEGHAYPPSLLATFEMDGAAHAVSAGGRESVDYEREIRVWNLAAGTLVHVLEGHQSCAGCLQIATVDGTPFAVTTGAECKDRRREGNRSWFVPNVDPSVAVWDLRQGERRFLLRGHNEPAGTLQIMMIRGEPHALTSGGKLYHFHSDVSEALLWNLVDGRLSARLEGQKSAMSLIETCERDGEMRILTVHDKDPGIRVWNPLKSPAREGDGASGSQPTHGSTPSASLFQERSSPQALTWDRSSLVTWSLRNGRSIGTLQLPDVRWVATCSIDGEPQLVLASWTLVFLVDLTQTRAVWQHRISFDWARGIEIVQGDGLEAVFVFSSEQMTALDLRSGRVLSQARPPVGIGALAAYSRGGVATAITSADHAKIDASETDFRFWDVRSGQERDRLRTPHRTPAERILLAEWDSSFHAVTFGGSVNVDAGGTTWPMEDYSVHVWNIEAQKHVASLASGGFLFHPQILDEPGERPRLLAQTESEVFVWDLLSGEEQGRVQVEPGFRLAGVVDVGGELCFYAGGEDGTIGLWALDRGRSLFVQKAHVGAVASLTAVRATNRAFLVSAGDTTIRVWDAHDGQQLAWLGADTPVGAVLAYADESVVRVVGSGTGGEVHILELVHANGP